MEPLRAHDNNDHTNGTGNSSSTTSQTTRDFEYKEKNIIDQVNKVIREELKGFELYRSDQEVIMVTLATAYGEAFETSAKGTRHKSAAHDSFIFNLTLEIEWYGRRSMGETTLGSAAGKVIVSDIAYDCTRATDWQLKVKLDSDGTAAMSQGPPPEPSIVQAELRNLVQDNGVSKLCEELEKLVTRFNEEGVQRQSDANDKLPGVEGTEGKEDVLMTKGTESYLKNLREQMLGEPFRKLVLAEDNERAIHDTQGIWKLDFCSMELEEVKQLSQQLKSHAQSIKRLSMDYNKITDDAVPILMEALDGASELHTFSLRKNNLTTGGLQTLVASLCLGTMPALKMLDLRENDRIVPNSATDAILNGLKAFRKHLEVQI